jgi:predicted aspartyl protease
MKHHNLLCPLLLATLMSFAVLPGSAESSQKATVSMRPYRGTRPVVAVKVNGTGPYDFLVDTGATVTVLDTALFNELGLRAEGTAKIISSAGASSQIRSVVKEITLDCLSVGDVAVVSMKSPMTGDDYRAVRGILGENFLRHFDILFDNQHRKMTLDTGDSLADSLSGERLPITFPPLPEGDENRYQPTISVKVEAHGHASLLLDSGATWLALLQPRIEWTGLGGRVTLRTVNGSLVCQDTDATLYLGKRTIKYLDIVNCQTATGKTKDLEGILPTAIFQQIFISHAGPYAIVNPTQRTKVPQEIAAVTPLSQ